jgi:hypothetical protein
MLIKIFFHLSLTASTVAFDNERISMLLTQNMNLIVHLSINTSAVVKFYDSIYFIKIVTFFLTKLYLMRSDNYNLIMIEAAFFTVEAFDTLALQKSYSEIRINSNICGTSVCREQISRNLQK